MNRRGKLKERIFKFTVDICQAEVRHHVNAHLNSFHLVIILALSLSGASLNFTRFVVNQRIITNRAHNSSRVNSIFFLFFPPPCFSLCGVKNSQRHGANLRPIVGRAIVGLMKDAFKSLFLLNCFASAFNVAFFGQSCTRQFLGMKLLFHHSSWSR